MGGGLKIETVELVLLVAVVVAIVARRLRVPYTVGFVAAGALVALTGIATGFVPTKDLIFKVLLPPLVFEAAFALRWDRLRAGLGPIALFATAGLLVAAGIVWLGMVRLAGWDFRAAFAFAVLISATDPVSVLASFKDAGVGGRIRTIVEGESLLNDGVAAALFAVALALGAGEPVGAWRAWEIFLLNAGGGTLAGVLVGLVALVLLRGTSDHLVEIAVSAVAAYGAFLLAETAHLSGVMATLAAGLVLGNLGPISTLSARAHEEGERFWEFAAFVANAFVFVLIGVSLTRASFGSALVASGLAIVLVLLGRAVAVYGGALLLRGKARLNGREQHVLFWGGLRGALALGLALGLPPDFPMLAEIKTATFAAVAFSVIVQGMTVSPLIRRAGADPA